MPFYVKLGPKGFFFRAGTMIIGVVGGLTYWRASRKRRRIARLATPHGRKRVSSIV